MANKEINGCGYGRVTRQISEDMKSQIEDIKKTLTAIDLKIDGINAKSQQMFNHLSNRAPHWASIIITILAGLLGVTLGFMLKIIGG